MLLRDLIVEVDIDEEEYAEYYEATLLDLNGDMATVKFTNRSGGPKNVSITLVRLPPKYNDDVDDFEVDMEVEGCLDSDELDGWCLGDIIRIDYEWGTGEIRGFYLDDNEFYELDEIRMVNRNPPWNINNFKHAEFQVAECYFNDFRGKTFIDQFCLEAGAFYAKLNQSTSILDVIFYNKRAIIPVAVRDKYAAPVVPPMPTLPPLGPVATVASAVTNFLSIASSMVSDLECPICKNSMRAPIMLCVTGHSFCKACLSRLPNCAICKQRFTTTRNLVLESVAKKLAAYQLSSAPSLYKCQIPGCNWSGDKTHLITHWSKQTKRSPFSQSTELVMKLEPAIGQPHILRAFNEYFWYKTKVTADAVMWAVQYIGPNEKANEYSFEIALGRKKSLVYRGRCQSLNLTNQVLFGNASHCLYVGLGTLDVYIKDNQFYFTITILKP